MPPSLLGQQLGKSAALGAVQKYGMPSTGVAAANNQPDFVSSVLKQIGAPVNSNTTKALRDWMAAEGGPSDNPLNTTIGQGGAQGSAIKGYGSVGSGISATVRTLQNGLYNNVLQAFKSSDQRAVRQAVVNSPWDVNHYQGTDYRAALGSTPSTKAPPAPAAQTSSTSTPGLKFPAIPGLNIPNITVPGTVTAPQETRSQALTAALMSSGGKPLSMSALLSAARMPTSISAIPGVSNVNVAGLPASGSTGASTVPTTTPGGRPTPLIYGKTAPNSLLSGSAVYAGPDQGLDFTGRAQVHALGDAVVTRVVPSGSGWSGQGGLLVYRLTSGPNAGRYVYTAEDFVPSVREGDQIKQGQVIGMATGSGQAPGIETGFAMNAQGQAYGTPTEGKGGRAPDPQAMAFARYVQTVAPAGVKIHAKSNGQIIPYRTST